MMNRNNSVIKQTSVENKLEKLKTTGLNIKEKKELLMQMLSHSSFFYKEKYATPAVKLGLDLKREFPDNPDISVMLGNVYMWMADDRVKAVKNFEDALNLSPNNCLFYK
jgi:hypothetical protein